MRKCKTLNQFWKSLYSTLSSCLKFKNKLAWYLWGCHHLLNHTHLLKRVSNCSLPRHLFVLWFPNWGACSPIVSIGTTKCLVLTNQHTQIWNANLNSDMAVLQLWLYRLFFFSHIHQYCIKNYKNNPPANVPQWQQNCFFRIFKYEQQAEKIATQ